MTTTAGAALHVLLIDNYDSYTYNLAHLVGAVTGELPTVVTADAYESILHYEKSAGKQVDAIVISPGPGDPNNDKDFLPLPTSALQQRDIPVLGICLGMQAMVPKDWIRRGSHPAHGIVSRIRLNDTHHGNSIWKNIPREFLATRYHSLVVAPPDDRRKWGHFVVDAWTNDAEDDDNNNIDNEAQRVVMALHRTDRPHYGVQFHPESIASQHGEAIVQNFLRIAAEHRRAHLVTNGCSAADDSNGAHHGATIGIIGSNGAALPAMLFRMKHRKLQCDLSSEQIFRALFDHAGDDEYNEHNEHDEHDRRCSSFWLDSSRCGDGAADGRYSIMGDSTGPNCEIVEYDVAKKQVTVTVKKKNKTCSDGAVHATTQRYRYSDVSIFDFLKTQLSSRKVEENHLNDLSAPLDIINNNMCGGYVGYFGYELRAQVEGVTSFLHEHHEHHKLHELHEHHEGGTKEGSSTPTPTPGAFFIFSDRFIIIDHVLDEKYAVALYKQDEGEEMAADGWFDGLEKALSVVVEHGGNENAENDENDENDANDGTSDELEDMVGAIVQEELLTFELERSREEYMGDIGVAMDYLRRGESYEICLTNRLRARAARPISRPLAVYSALRRENPAPYSAYLRIHGGLSVCCSSPERFLSLKTARKGRHNTSNSNDTDDEYHQHEHEYHEYQYEIESKPIKGTRARHPNDPMLDARAADSLRNSSKDRRENLMIVDLVRNDLSRVCRLGSVRVPYLMRVESYATVHQLVSTVRGTLTSGTMGCDAVRTSFPMGSMTGAPKARTLDIIDTLERSPRGIYSGSIGYLSLCGNMDFNVVIRTAVIRDKEVIEIGVGGAIVALSDAAEEFHEIITKGNPIMRALSIALTGQPKFILKT